MPRWLKWDPTVTLRNSRLTSGSPQVRSSTSRWVMRGSSCTGTTEARPARMACIRAPLRNSVIRSWHMLSTYCCRFSQLKQPTIRLMHFDRWHHLRNSCNNCMSTFFIFSPCPKICYIWTFLWAVCTYSMYNLQSHIYTDTNHLQWLAQRIQILVHWRYIASKLTHHFWLLALGSEYSRRMKSLLWLLMTWHLVSPGHQLPYYLIRINGPLSSMWKDFNYLCHFNVKNDRKCKYISISMG